MLADVIGLVDAQLEASQREIADVRGILADAVARLMRDRCGAGDPSGHPGGAGVDMVTALQFQDLSDQLLAHTTSRLDVLRGEMQQVRGELSAGGDAGDRAAWHSIAVSVQRNLTAFATRRQRPVAAAQLEPGTVELF
jgi:hypothetical protein